MSLRSFFRQHAAESVVLIDIGSASISGAYARIDRAARPVLYYTARVPIRARSATTGAADMEHALSELATMLVIRGAPVMAHAVGKGTIDKVLVSIAAPWQETRTRTERVHRPTPFRFTRRLMEDMVKKITLPLPGYTQTNKMVVATLLNGYEVAEPFGKSAHTAEVIALSSSVVDAVAQTVTTIMRRTFHTDQVTLTAFVPVAYTVLRNLYPHEEDFLIMDVTGEATDLALIKQGLLVEVASVSSGLNTLRRAALAAGFSDSSSTESLRTVEEVALIDMEHNPKFTQRMRVARDEWIDKLSEAFQALTVKYALPRAIFLLAGEEALGFLKHVLDDESDLQRLWLSDDALPILALDPGQFARHVTYRDNARGDTFLSLLALYVAHCSYVTDTHT
ncbi:MAG: hypothetical protein B7X04_01085 [Parcubacteria group bacterium 21-54-25]|nr:MAG: hypothetical protein B7X04_01085 [Parcubacteria group bacterium 21-54-25]HQU07827.1 hypothetical protein [Candidatus Paceibacterota bacterium]